MLLHIVHKQMALFFLPPILLVFCPEGAVVMDFAIALYL